jgi:GNAT superfamily N-acetyltransferase
MMFTPNEGKRFIHPDKTAFPRLRKLEESDLGAAHGLSVAVGWPHRLSDWQAIFAIGRGYCLYDAIGRLIGTAMWWPMEPGFAMVGMVIVDPGFQGQGLGKRLMKAVMRAAKGRTLQLNSTMVGMKLYESKSFRAAGTLRQLQGITRPPKRRDAAFAAVRPLVNDDWAAVLELDRVASGHDREDILRVLTRGAAGWISERDGRVAGFAFCRAAGRGRVIGPVIATDVAIAIDLARPIFIENAGQFLRIDVPDGNTDFTRFMEECGLQCAGRATTMIRGPLPSRNQRAEIFGLCNQAIG